MEKIKNLLLALLLIPIVLCSEEKKQLKVIYNANYKLPFLKKMFKSTLPKSFTVYYSEIANRVEFDNDFKIFGKKVNMSFSEINNYNELKTQNFMNFSITNDNDTTGAEIDTLLIDTASKISYTGERKKINNIECIGFHMDNNDSNIKGFLSEEFSAIGAIIKGRDFGLPLFLIEYNKKEKITTTLEIKSISLEPLQKKLFIIKNLNDE